MELMPTGEMGAIVEEQPEEPAERSFQAEEGLEEESRLSDLMSQKRQFAASVRQHGRDVSRRKEQEREQVRHVAADQELRAVNQEEFIEFVEYFPPITEKPIALVQDADDDSPSAKRPRKGKGATQKTPSGRRAVAAYEKGSDDFGEINFYGIVHKRRGKTVKFHTRWMVLRGIDLFWYRSASDHEQKGVVRLPSIQLQHMKVGRAPCFSIMESGDRELTFRDNEHGHHFRVALANAIGLKLFMEERFSEVGGDLQRDFDRQTIAYFRNAELDALEYKNQPQLLKYYALIFKNLPNHERLLSLTLSGCKLDNEHLLTLAQALTSYRNELARLDLSLNDLNARSLSHIFTIFKSPNCAALRVLILDDNYLQDAGVQRLASSLYDRFEILNAGRKMASAAPTAGVELHFPLDFLSLSGVGMGDQGLASLVSRLDQIRLKALAQTGSADAF